MQTSAIQDPARCVLKPENPSFGGESYPTALSSWDYASNIVPKSVASLQPNTILLRHAFGKGTG